MKTKKESGIQKQALGLVSDPLFLYKAAGRIGEFGVVGEKRNRLILLLAGIARVLPDPPSVLVKGTTSSGKSTLVKKSIQLFPRDCIVERAGLSRKALAYGNGSLSKKILFINEYRCGKESQLLLRLLQSEGQIRHESTAVQGSRRRTQTVQRVGVPVVLTTTTDDKVFIDDETRFLSVWVDESASQTLAILTEQARGRRAVSWRDLPVWRAAMALLVFRKEDFRNPPVWLQYVARQLPLTSVRVRRDWNKFLSFCQAVALCRRFGLNADSPLDINFSDYCVAYRILEPVLSSITQGLPGQELELARTVAVLNKRLGRAVMIREIAEELDWKESFVYKHAKRAAQHKLLEYESVIREKNVKRLLATTKVSNRFLPSPISVFENNPEIGPETRYVDPFTGKRRIIH